MDESEEVDESDDLEESEEDSPHAETPRHSTNADAAAKVLKNFEVLRMIP